MNEEPIHEYGQVFLNKVSNKSKDSFYTIQIIISNEQSKSQHVSLKLTKEYISINKGKIT